MSTTTNPWDLLVTQYRYHRAALKGLCALSQRQCKYVLGDFANGMAGVDPAQVSLEDIEAYFGKKHWAASTIRTRLGVIRPFLAWAARRHHCPQGLAAEIHGPRQNRLLPRALSVAQVRGLLNHLPDARARVIVLLMAQAGLRVHEVARLHLRDFNLHEGIVRVKGKGGVERDLWLSEETRLAIRHWLIERGSHGGPLVSSYLDDRKGVTSVYVGMLVRQWMFDSGLDATAHCLRHTAATELIRGGAHIAVVQNALGHANLSTTARYLRVYDADLREAMTGIIYQDCRTTSLATG